jgi:hypothetical protein
MKHAQELCSHISGVHNLLYYFENERIMVKLHTTSKVESDPILSPKLMLMHYSISFRLVGVFTILSFFLSCPIPAATQTSRGTVVNPVDIQLPTLNYSEIYKLKAIQREKAIESCLHEIMLMLLRDFDQEKCEATFVDIESSWIETLILFEYPETGHTHVLMKVFEGDYYQYIMPKVFFELWIESDSKGDFYHKFVKNSREFSVVPLCEKLID